MKQKNAFSLALTGYKKLLVVGFLSFLLLIFTAMFFYNIAIRIIIQICCGTMLIGILYEPFWAQGNHDANYIERGLEKCDKFKGLKSGFIMIIPSIITWIFLIIDKFTINIGFFNAFAMLNSPFRWIFTWIAPLPYEQFKSDGLPMNWTEYSSILSILLCVLVFLIIPIVTHISYTLGLKRIDLSEKIVYKSQKNGNHAK